MISALKCLPPVPNSASHQCPAVPPTIMPITAQPCHPSVPISYAHQYPTVAAASAISQCFQSGLSASTASQRCPSVQPISDHHCCISVQHHQCLLINAHLCHLISATSSVQPISAHQYCLSMPLHQCPSMLSIS
ncbi:unnamed protein product, partial [Staurois parvus]